MKFVFIIGSQAVGKMTVGQELAKITGLKLFHNHIVLEPLFEVFGEFKGQLAHDIRELIFKDFSKTNNKGMIYTIVLDFNLQTEWDYIEHIKNIFSGSEFYYVELVASQEIRIQRNATENRLKYKASKRNIKSSENLIYELEKKHRCESYDGEVKFDNYIKIDNSNLAPEEVASMIKEKFNL